MRSLNASASLSRTISFAALALIAVLLPLLLLRAAGRDWVAALRDSALSNVPEAGLLSDGGIILLIIAATVSALAWAITRSPPTLGLAMFCFLFAADDGLMLHERLGNYEPVVIAAFGVGFALVWRQLAVLHQKALLWPLALVAAAFAASAAFDLIGGFIEPALSELMQRGAGHVLYGLEDVPKKVGILCLTFVTVNEALDAIRARRVRGHIVRSGRGTAPQW